MNYQRLSTSLYRSLERLSLSIEACSKIGFEESKPTTNATHGEIWMALNEAQKDAKLKLKHYQQLVSEAAIRATPASEPALEPPAPVEAGDREQKPSKQYIYDAAIKAAFKRGQEEMRGEALWSVKTPVPSGNGDYQLGFLHGQRVAQRAIRALPVEESK